MQNVYSYELGRHALMKEDDAVAHDLKHFGNFPNFGFIYALDIFEINKKEIIAAMKKHGFTKQTQSSNSISFYRNKSL